MATETHPHDNDNRPVCDLKHRNCYYFDDIKLCPCNRELISKNQEIPLENKPLDFLIYLINHRDRAVSKEELRAAIWQNRPLSETVISRCAMKVRRALKDDGHTQSKIKTIPGYGYRFTANVKEKPINQSQHSRVSHFIYELWEYIRTLGKD